MRNFPLFNMMQIKKLAAVDIGSNGVRMLISNVIETENEVKFTKVNLVRMPIRLGSDVFTSGEISSYNKERLLDACLAYQLIFKVHQIENYRFCATSAMREALNSKEIVDEIYQKINVKIDVISPEEEAEILSIAGMFSFLEQDKNYLYIDVGGGSTEFTVVNYRNKLSKSFPIGAVKLLEGNFNEAIWQEIEFWIKENTKDLGEVISIGSGGNINRIAKEYKEKTIPISFLENFTQLISEMSYDERIEKIGLNPDRADVMPLAMPIYIKAMQWANSKNIIVPKFGLVDGIVKKMYYDKKG